MFIAFWEGEIESSNAEWSERLRILHNRRAKFSLFIKKERPPISKQNFTSTSITLIQTEKEIAQIYRVESLKDSTAKGNGEKRSSSKTTICRHHSQLPSDL